MSFKIQLILHVTSATVMDKQLGGQSSRQTYQKVSESHIL